MPFAWYHSQSFLGTLAYLFVAGFNSFSRLSSLLSLSLDKKVLHVFTCKYVSSKHSFSVKGMQSRWYVCISAINNISCKNFSQSPSSSWFHLQLCVHIHVVVRTTTMMMMSLARLKFSRHFITNDDDDRDVTIFFDRQERNEMAKEKAAWLKVFVSVWERKERKRDILAVCTFQDIPLLDTGEILSL